MPPPPQELKFEMLETRGAAGQGWSPLLVLFVAGKSDLQTHNFAVISSWFKECCEQGCDDASIKSILAFAWPASLAMKRHVFRNHHHVPYLASAALIGVALGVLMRLFEPMGRFLFPRVVTYQELNPLIAAFIAIAVVIIVRRDCPHRRWRFAMCAAAAAGAYVTMFLFFPFYGSRPLFTGKFALVLLAKTVLPGLIGGLVGYTVWVLRDLIFGAPIVQDGVHCGNCGYSIRGLPTSRCPECGMNYRDDGIDPNPPPVLRAWRGVGMWVAVVLFLTGTMYVAFPRLAGARKASMRNLESSGRPQGNATQRPPSASSDPRQAPNSPASILPHRPKHFPAKSRDANAE